MPSLAYFEYNGLGEESDRRIVEAILFIAQDARSFLCAGSLTLATSTAWVHRSGCVFARCIMRVSVVALLEQTKSRHDFLSLGAPLLQMDPGEAFELIARPEALLDACPSSVQGDGSGNGNMETEAARDLKMAPTAPPRPPLVLVRKWSGIAPF